MDCEAVPSDYSHIIDCVCGWGQARDIIELITDWLAKAVSNRTVVSRHKLFIFTLLELKYFACYLLIYLFVFFTK